jgi:hypothetical protein
LRPLVCVLTANAKVKLTGSFGVFFSGRLIARFYDKRGALLGAVPVTDASPTEPVSLDTEVSPSGVAARVSLHLEDERGLDRGALEEVRIAGGDNR